MVGSFDIRTIPRNHGERQEGLVGSPERLVRVARNTVAPIGCCVGLLVIFLGVLLSLGTLKPTEYGLRYNMITKQVDTSQVYQSGRHFIGPFSSLLTFPATVQSLEFSNRHSATAQPLSTRTAEGLSLTLHIAFQYHLIQDEIPALYQLANRFYEPLYLKVARDILLKAAAQFTAPEYWLERPEVGEKMLKYVNDGLRSSHATCTGLQLLVIELPDKYEASIVATQVQKQGIKTRENEQRAALIRAEIDVMIAGYQNEITVILSGAHANATLVTKRAEALASQMKFDAENVVADEVQSKLRLSPVALVGYQRTFAYQNIPNATMLFGVSNAFVSTNNGAPAEQACAAKHGGIERASTMHS
eukprot:TRINITY_DN16727_c0_g5_i1.p1 TRINITY_DN16727_c0_g5~~TRINITY_DN16727_c0_g5_i1.p1  ORF type:complete len:360 (-),score=43.90 TRINITY_DN16727_c0_g5_i1:106-1185(-)